MATQQTISTSYLTAGGVQYAYRFFDAVQPSNSTPPLLMLNHFRSNMDLWDPAVINSLAKTRPVLLYDYAGHGHSAGAVATSIKDMSSNLASFLEKFSESITPVATGFDVLGFSIGGYVAQQLVLDSPPLVRHLVIAGSGGSAGPLSQNTAPDKFMAMSAQNVTQDAVISLFFPITETAAGQAWLQRSFERSKTLPKGETFLSFMDDPQKISRLQDAVLSWFADTSPEARLLKIDNKVLVASGQDDAVVPPVNSWALSQTLKQGLLHVFPLSGHGFLFQYHEQFVALVNNFLDGKLF